MATKKKSSKPQEKPATLKKVDQPKKTEGKSQGNVEGSMAITKPLGQALVQRSQLTAVIHVGPRDSRYCIVGSVRFRAASGSSVLKPDASYDVVEQTKGHVTLRAGDKQVVLRRCNPLQEKEQKKPAPQKDAQPKALPAKRVQAADQAPAKR